MPESIKLSICIATYNRGQFIGETLDSILGQLEPGVEIIVVDGASPDNTPEVMVQYLTRYPNIRYYREQENSGVDRDYDKAVGYARGEYCWLMTDDDLLRSGAITTVLSALGGEDDLIIVNSEVRNTDLSVMLERRRLELDTDREYSGEAVESFFADTANYLSFIGCVVVRRTCWLSRDRSSYYGTLFIHVGVIFQNPPIANIRLIAEPLIIIRYGNAMWTSRSFEIWLFKWPKLIWSFPDFSDTAKRMICRREPWRSVQALFHQRALGSYTTTELRRFWPTDTLNVEYFIAYLVSVFPAKVANFLVFLYFIFSAKSAAPLVLHDLLHSPHAGTLSCFLARVLRLERR